MASNYDLEAGIPLRTLGFRDSSRPQLQSSSNTNIDQRNPRHDGLYSKILRDRQANGQESTPEDEFYGSDEFEKVTVKGFPSIAAFHTKYANTRICRAFDAVTQRLMTIYQCQLTCLLGALVDLDAEIATRSETSGQQGSQPTPFDKEKFISRCLRSPDQISLVRVPTRDGGNERNEEDDEQKKQRIDVARENLIANIERIFDKYRDLINWQDSLRKFPQVSSGTHERLFKHIKSMEGLDPDVVDYLRAYDDHIYADADPLYERFYTFLVYVRGAFVRSVKYLSFKTVFATEDVSFGRGAYNEQKIRLFVKTSMVLACSTPLLVPVGIIYLLNPGKFTVSAVISHALLLNCLASTTTNFRRLSNARARVNSTANQGMSDPFSTPPRGGGRGGRGASTPPRPAQGSGGGGGKFSDSSSSGIGSGGNSPDPFSSPPRAPQRANLFARPPTRQGWPPLPRERDGNGERDRWGRFGGDGRGGMGARGRRVGEGSFGLFGGRTAAPMDDPFGGSSVAGGAERQNWLQRATKLFNDQPRFMVEKTTVSRGGMLLRVVEMLDSGRVYRRFVVKASSSPSSAGVIRREMGWTHRVRFARHIVKWMTLMPDPMAPSLGNEGLSRPYFFVEYLENVIRACVGMAWPPDGPDVVLEVPAPSEPLTLAHMDLHSGNVMFGDLDERELEHGTVPVAKLIDLGEANERPAGEATVPPDPLAMNRYDNVLLLATHRPETGRRNQGIDKNILDVGVLMANLITNVPGFAITCRRNIMDTSIHPYLDEDLRLLVQRCLAIDPENRPRLEELVELVGEANSPFFRDEKYYKKNQELAAIGVVNPAEELETDDALNVVVQNYIFNADPDASSSI
ncbi:hypothetical protein FHL15_001931 [Xylaria flabelliformis]|uniref:Protein kinase domain-containing protein n=1 Tax=Xylaria flabelliformis TaxID=2512241 RepID=A0A553IAB3_9PEZI|nr:hypothetical protein FHL15_001931 [Xylaria flabelliformis]